MTFGTKQIKAIVAVALSAILILSFLMLRYYDRLDVATADAAFIESCNGLGWNKADFSPPKIYKGNEPLVWCAEYQSSPSSKIRHVLVIYVKCGKVINIQKLTEDMD